MKKLLAKVTSIILGPIIIWPITLLIIVSKANLLPNNYWVISLTFFFLLVVLPFSYIYLLYKKKIISDLDLTKRQQRFKPLLLGLILFTLSTITVYFYGDILLLHLFLIIFFLFIVNFIVTLFWKISYHVAQVTVTTILINYLFNWRFPVLYAFIPLVFWSRLYLKKHDFWQLLGAFVLNGIIVILFLRSFNYV